MVDAPILRHDMIFVIVSDETGEEGIVAPCVPGVGFAPMVFFKEHKMQRAVALCERQGFQYRVLCFSTRTDVTKWAKGLK